LSEKKLRDLKEVANWCVTP